MKLQHLSAAIFVLPVFSLYLPCLPILSKFLQTSEPPQITFVSTHKALKQSHVIPDVLPDFVPSCKLHIAYSDRDKVSLGNKLKTSHTKSKPTVHVSCHDHVRGPFTIALTDPDAPSRDDPKWSEMCHWISTDAEKSDLVDYKPPGPPENTGYHRYVFVLLNGENSNLTAPSDRQHWGTGKARHGVANWAQSQGLHVVGADFFYEKHE